MSNSKTSGLIHTLNIVHAYLETQHLKSLENSTKAFKSYTPKTLQTLAQNKTLPCDILFIELPLLTKENFVNLNTLVKNYYGSEIYIFAKDPEKPFLLKFALHFGLNKISLLQDNPDLLGKLLEEASHKILSKQEEKQQVEVSKRVNSFFAFLVFSNGSLTFANDKAKNIFEANKLQDLESIIKNNQSIYPLLSSSDEKNGQVILENSQKERWKYTVFVNKFGKSGEKLISLVPNRILNTDEAFLTTLNRFKFIEELKDKLAQNATIKSDMILLMININNYEKLLRACNSLQIHNFIKKFITKLSSHKENYQDLVQWNPHFFILLFEKKNFEEAKVVLDSLHQKLIYNKIDKEISAIINSSALKIDHLDINEIIENVDKINNQTISYDDFTEDEFFQIQHLDSYEDEREQIHHYLKSCIGNKTSVKLLNIYKGLCINTKSNILKANADKSYLVHCESLQGYSMQFENRTVLQSPDLPRDIQASIIHVNIEKSQALINDVYFLEASANNRQHTRVQPSFRTPIQMKYKKNSYHGELIDLSTQAIAIKFNHSLSSALKEQKIELNFKLPDASSDLGYLPMYVTGKVVYVGELSLTKTKIVVMMEFEKPYDAYLLRYMYNRQKDLIIELKKVNKLNTKKKSKAV